MIATAPKAVPAGRNAIPLAVETACRVNMAGTTRGIQLTGTTVRQPNVSGIAVQTTRAESVTWAVIGLKGAQTLRWQNRTTAILRPVVALVDPSVVVVPITVSVARCRRVLCRPAIIVVINSGRNTANDCETKQDFGNVRAVSFGLGCGYTCYGERSSKYCCNKTLGHWSILFLHPASSGVPISMNQICSRGRLIDNDTTMLSDNLHRVTQWQRSCY
jgi:hypothetical protein